MSEEEQKQKIERTWEVVEEDGKKVHISDAGNIVEENGVFYFMFPVGLVSSLGPFDDLNKLKEQVDEITHDVKLHLNKSVSEYNEKNVIGNK